MKPIVVRGLKKCLWSIYVKAFPSIWQFVHDISDVTYNLTLLNIPHQSGSGYDMLQNEHLNITQ
jgi:hypothetical protein